MKHRIVYPSPLLPLAICLMAGICIGHLWPLPLPLLPVLAGIVVVAWLVGRWPMVQSFIIHLSLFFIGFCLIQKTDTPKAPDTTAHSIQQHYLDKFRHLDAESEAYGVLAAMTLGDKSAITKEVRDTYSITGASHVLALSGLHLGIIYMLLLRLLPRRRMWLSQLVVVLALWAFAFITGLSTSIVRSATMISIYAVFSLRGSHQSSLNTLCLAAIIMLLVDAHCLFDISFQLSFMAVLAILLIMPMTEHFVSPSFLDRHPLVRWLWNIVAVSVAAQIGVAPLIAYYFGRFSTYFFLTNILVLPIITVILYGSLLFFVTGWTFVGQGLLSLTAMLNHWLGTMAQWPLASIDGLHPSILQVCMIYVAEVAIALILLKFRPEKMKYDYLLN